jgi:hypothetical protein
MGILQHEKFIKLRAQGFSLRQCAKKLKLSESTTQRWGQLYVNQISELRKIRFNELVQKYGMLSEARLKSFGEELKKIEKEIQKRMKGDGLDYISLSGLIDLKFRYHEHLSSELDINMIEKCNTSGVMSFEEFCNNASYPKPYPKQSEMRDYAFSNTEPTLILGSRGYGKTDYITICGVAYEIFKDPQFSCLLVTKSDDRNKAILGEVETVCKLNGIDFEIANAHNLRLAEKLGKDHNYSALTVRAKGFRGRHPNRIIMDDPITPDDTSEAERSRVKKAYDECYKLTSAITIIGQPVHADDLYMELRPVLKNKLEIPYGNIPELDPDLEAQRLAGVSEESIQASYFLNIELSTDRPFQNIKDIDRFPTGKGAIAWIDPSFEGGDYTAISILTGHFDGVAVVGFVWKKSWDNCIDDIYKRCKQFNVGRLAFECNNLGNTPINILRQTFEGIGIVKKYTKVNKHAKIINAGVYAHLIHISRESDKQYVDQVKKYEYNVKHDDAPDSLASILLWLGLIKGGK